MFNNPGAKIKGLAKTLFWIEVIGVIVTLLAMADYVFDDEGIFIAIAILVVGIGVAYLSSLFLAAFGELVQTNTEISNTNKQILEEVRKQNAGSIFTKD